MAESSDAREEATGEEVTVEVPTREEVGRGLVFLHGALGTGLLQTAEVQGHLYALTELLITKGVIGLKEFERRKQSATQEAIHEVTGAWPGAQVHADGTDKYTAEPAQIDCLQRLHLCHAACCRMNFQLSRQDVEENIVQWDFSRPYHIRQRDDGWCAHCDPATKSCGVRDHRPIVCRQYDCRDDQRVWVDFEKRIPAPDVAALGAPPAPEEKAP